MKQAYQEYDQCGDYHKTLDPNWNYLPVYLEKIKAVRSFLDQKPPKTKILDAGCGEGVLVEEYSSKDYDIRGIDQNYESEFVTRGDVLNTPYEDSSFDLILNLDVIEHLSFEEQESAVKEFHRLLKPGGELLISIPNLAHLASRISMMLTGKLIRTSAINRHPGDRPISEYLEMLGEYFKLENRKGLFPTYPLITLLTWKSPSKTIALHRIYNRFIAPPNLCFLNLCLFRKTA